MTSQQMFTLYLIENDDGQVRVITDYTGKGERCLALGVEIMQSLATIQPYTHGDLTLAMPARTDVEH
jgi:hypothetical protein